MKKKCASQIAIIGGADGPVSIFVAGKDGGCKVPLKVRIRNKRMQMRRKRAEKKIHPGAHTKEETIVYAKEHYGFLALDQNCRICQDEKKSVREGIIYKYKPELLGEFLHISAPDSSDEKSFQKFYELLQERERILDAVPDEEVPMEFQMYELLSGKGHIRISADFKWDIFGVSYGGDRKQMKKFKRIAQDLYSYYGVTEEDIENKTERYAALVCAKSDV